MTTLTTFGFEFEVETEGAALTRHLFGLGHTGQAGMCPWHCRCHYCEFGNDFLFRAQTDSSVPAGGEIVTNVLHHDPDDSRYRGDVFNILQEAAVATDAEPGLRAGLHVHVGIGHLSSRQLDRAFWAYLRYENVLTNLASGRWPNQRGNNESVTNLLGYSIRSHGDGSTGREGIASIENSDHFGRDIMAHFREEHYSNDRHSNLNLRTDHGTWEFRLWNSTRSAWRMEMFTRLSVALVDPDVVTAMLEADLPLRATRRALDRFASLLMDAGHDDCAVLIDRQATYSTERADTAPSTLTQL